MELRTLGRTGWRISPIGFGAWAIDGDAWGPTNDDESLQALHRAVDLGVNFLDTADGDGHSERLVGRLRRERREEIVVATKAGRRLERQEANGYSRANLTSWVERSLRNLGTEAIDLLQLHCPPSEVYDMPEVFGILDDLARTGGTTAIPGARTPDQVEQNVRAAELPPLSATAMAAVRAIYDRDLRGAVHDRW